MLEPAFPDVAARRDAGGPVTIGIRRRGSHVGRAKEEAACSLAIATDCISRSAARFGAFPRLAPRLAHELQAVGCKAYRRLVDSCRVRIDNKEPAAPWKHGREIHIARPARLLRQ